MAETVETVSPNLKALESKKAVAVVGLEKKVEARSPSMTGTRVSYWFLSIVIGGSGRVVSKARFVSSWTLARCLPK